jgi:hypothetical protein
MSNNLLQKFANLSDELFELGIIRTDSFTEEIGEYVFSKSFNLDRTNRSSEAVDAIDNLGKKYQIKAKVVSNNKYNCSYSDLEQSLFDFLVVVFFDEEYSPLKAFKIESKYLQNKVSINFKFLDHIPHELINVEKLQIDKNIQNKLSEFGKQFIELKENGVIKSRHIVGDIGEYYAANKLNLKLCQKNKKGIDAIDEMNQTYEIKTRRVYESGRRKGNTRRLNNLVGKFADYLIVVTLNRNFECNGMWKMPLKNVENPKSAHLGIVRNTKETEIIIPTDIDWLK